MFLKALFYSRFYCQHLRNLIPLIGSAGWLCIYFRPNIQVIFSHCFLERRRFDKLFLADGLKLAVGCLWNNDRLLWFLYLFVSCWFGGLHASCCADRVGVLGSFVGAAFRADSCRALSRVLMDW